MSAPADVGSLLALGRRVRALRDALHLTQDAFARRCGISVSFASLLERGERSPSFETLVAIAHALEVPLGELFRERGAADAIDASHARLADFVRQAQLTRPQLDRFLAVGRAMFGLETDRIDGGGERLRCAVEGCERSVLARGLCGPHYHRARRARQLQERDA